LNHHPDCPEEILFRAWQLCIADFAAAQRLPCNTLRMDNYATGLISILLFPMLMLLALLFAYVVVVVGVLRELLAAVKAFHQDYKTVHNL
jgi:hypothetical protein